MKKIAIIGSHGIPARYGGFETFVEHLAVAMADYGFEVTVVNEKEHNVPFVHQNITILNSDFFKSIRPLAYYRDSIRLVNDCDVVILCGAGGSLFYSGLKNIPIITNIDGIEHKRKRYSFLQRLIVYFLERLAFKRSRYIIADSDHVRAYWNEKYSSHSHKIITIPYGADECLPFKTGVLEKFNLTENNYFLVIARLVPENNISTIINAFRHYKSNKKLVIIGSTNNTFASRLREISDSRVIFTEAIYDKPVLDTLRSHCGLYIHGHSVGGTNPSLLEAMAAGCACVCHDNVFNRETTAGTQEYFKDSFQLAIHLNALEHNFSHVMELKQRSINRVKDYTWNQLNEKYIKLINEI